MNQRTISLVVFFENPFWVGVFERTDSDRFQAAKIIFGAEPRDAEVLEMLLSNWTGLHFTAAERDAGRKAADSPKRRQRQAARALAERGPSTKSQRALAEARKAAREKRKMDGRQRDEERMRRIHALKQQKRKEKHRGH